MFCLFICLYHYLSLICLSIYLFIYSAHCLEAGKSEHGAALCSSASEASVAVSLFNEPIHGETGKHASLDLSSSYIKSPMPSWDSIPGSII